MDEASSSYSPSGSEDGCGVDEGAAAAAAASHLASPQAAASDTRGRAGGRCVGADGTSGTGGPGERPTLEDFLSNKAKHDALVTLCFQVAKKRRLQGLLPDFDIFVRARSLALASADADLATGARARSRGRGGRRGPGDGRSRSRSRAQPQTRTRTWTGAGAEPEALALARHALTRRFAVPFAAPRCLALHPAAGRRNGVALSPATGAASAEAAGAASVEGVGSSRALRRALRPLARDVVQRVASQARRQPWT